MKSVAIIIGSRFAVRGAQALAFVLLARALSPENFGTYGLFMAAVLLAGQIGNLGLRQSSALMIGRKSFSVAEVTATLLGAWPMLSALASGAVLYLNRDLLAGLGLTGQIATVLAIFASILIILLQGIFLGRGHVKSFGASDVAPRVALAALVAAFFAADRLTLPAAIWIFAASYMVAVPAVVLLALRNRDGALRFRNSALWSMLRYGGLFAISAFLIALNMRVGMFVIDDVADGAAVGQFFAAQRLIEIFLDVATAVGLVIFSDATREPDRAKAMRSAARAGAGLFWTFLVLAILVAAAMPYAIKLLLGPEYVGAVDTARILALGLAPSAVIKVMNGVTVGGGKPYVSAAVVGIGLLGNVGVTYLMLGSMLPQDAAAWGFVASQLIAAVLYIAIARVSYAVPVRLFFVPSLKRRSVKID